MPLPTAYMRVTLWFQSPDAKQFSNVLWYELSGSFPSNFNIATFASAVEGHFMTQLLNCLAQNMQYNGLDIEINNAGVTSTSSTFQTAPGTAATFEEQPNEVSALVRWQSSQPGRSGHGRSFMGGIPQAFINSGRLTSAAQGIIGTFASAIITSATNQGITFAYRLLSKKLNSMFPVSSYVVELLVGTQRRRRPRR